MKSNSLLIIVLLFYSKVFSQKNDTIVYFANHSIAYKKKADSVFFYNTSGKLRELIDLKNKKSIPFGLPKEIQGIILNGEVPENLKVHKETFPTYLYIQKYIDSGEVLCTEQVFYNQLGLKTGYIEVCPDDRGEEDTIFGARNLYKYNDYGLLIESENVIYGYDDNGRLLKVGYIKKDLSIVYHKEYVYEGDRLSMLKITDYKGVRKIKYLYNTKGLLSEIIQSKRTKLVLDYDDHHNLIKLRRVSNFRNKIFNHKILEYVYDDKQRITRIAIYDELNTLISDYYFTYDKKGNIYPVLPSGDSLGKRIYNKKGTLMYVENRYGEEKGYLTY